jgi:tripartite-type tricarboxylate transporter receptor subunit TctC
LSWTDKIGKTSAKLRKWEEIMEKKWVKSACFILCITAVFFGWTGGLLAQDYPKGPIQIVIPYGSGGLTDIFWRTVSESLANNIKGTITMVNKTGGSGVVGTSFVVNSKPDGYTLMNVSPEATSIARAFSPPIPYDMEKDITYIGKLVTAGHCIAVRSDSPFKTIEDVVAYAKANPRKLKSSVMGVSGTPRVILEVLKRNLKIDIVHVPFEGGGENVTALLGGHVDMSIVGLTPIQGQIASGKARLLAVSSPKRFPTMPQVPTLVEKGYMKSAIGTALGLAGPRGISPAIVSQWDAAIQKTLQDQKIVSAVENLAGIVIDYQSGEAYKKDLMDHYADYKEIAAAGTK